MTTGTKFGPRIGVALGIAESDWKKQTFNLQRLIVGKDLVDPLDPRILPQRPVMEIPFRPPPLAEGRRTRIAPIMGRGTPAPAGAPSAREAGGTGMARTREVYVYDYAADFGLSALAGTLCARSALRLDGPVVLDIAASEAEDDDHRIGADVRLLLDSPLPDDVLHTVWLAAVRRCFDPAEDGTDTRTWLDAVAELCPPRAPERDPYEVRSLDAVRPDVPEEELRKAVAAEIDSASAGMELRVAVPGIVPALLRVVREADADLAFRLFLRALKAYSVPVGADTYDRLLALGDGLAYPPAAVHEDLTVRWRPLDPGRRDLADGRFGLPALAAALRGTEWTYGGTPREHIQRVADDIPGHAPGTYAAVLLDDAWRLLDSALPGETVGLLWRTAAGRPHVLDEEEFDADGRAWLEQVSQVCHTHLAEVDPAYAPFLSPARTDLTEAVLREVREAVHAEAEQVRGVARVLEDVVTAVDPDLGFRLLLHLLDTYAVPVGEARRDRYRALAARLGLRGLGGLDGDPG